MRSPVIKHKPLWLACLFLVAFCGPAWAENAGEITGVRLDPENKRIVIASKGSVGKHCARVIGRPNRLVMDFEGTKLGQAPGKLPGGAADIHEIRVGTSKSRARVVVDFQNNPVPAFKVKREDSQILVVFGSSLSAAIETAAADAADGNSKTSALKSPLAPTFVPAAAAGAGPESGKTLRLDSLNKKPAANKNATAAVAPDKRNGPAAEAQKAASNGIKMAQGPALNQPPTAPFPKAGTGDNQSPASTTAGLDKPHSGPPNGGPQMVREVRPPVTPPTPDPRLLVQEITELQFIQVGHNARLVVRGGDHLDYRMTKVSPTKLRLDLINAEIPKVHQKPLKTDLFSTSVEMIVPGSQTIFIQLKDAVPAQVEKKKGVLMVDFPPPRFAMTRDQMGTGRPAAGDAAGREAASQIRETRREAIKVMREEEIRRDNERRDREIQALERQQDELQKQRTEILKRYQISPDPEIFTKPVTMDFQGISLKNAFRLLGEQAGINIIVGDGVPANRTATLRMFQVPLGQVMETILNTHDLDKEMVGNVMRVDSRAKILQYKNARQKEYQTRIVEVDKRLKEMRDEVQKKQAENEKALKELERKEIKAEEPVDDTRTEEFGEAECIDIEGERVCFQYATIRIVHKSPTVIRRTLDCVFNLQCPGAYRGRQRYTDLGEAVFGAAAEPGRAVEIGPGTTTTVGGPADTTQLPQGSMNREQFEESMRGQGFTPGNLRYEQELEAWRRAQEQTTSRRVQEAAALQRMGQGPRATGSIDLPFGTDPKLVKILAQSVLYADEANRLIFIKDTPDRIAQMRKLIYQLDVPTPQVLIESRVVQADRDWSRGLGILWGGRNDQSGLLSVNRKSFWGVNGSTAGAGTIVGATANPPQPEGTLIPSQFSVNLPVSIANLASILGGGVQYGFLAGNYLTELDFRLQIGESTGQTKIIARPKVQVLDGEKASIKNGQTIAFVTASPLLGTQTQLVDVDLLLDVRPRIFQDGRIQMEIKVTDNDVGAVINGQASINRRESQTRMIVKDGDTAVIGGIVRKTDNSRRQGWPGLMNVPIIDVLFTNKTRDTRIQELLVFITPTIIKRPPQAS
ncbi:MAG: AMIN domain-containing protein [Desulfomonile tiedjei]|nr:AMIN domain-containing protein [Desulfomonile tiedjei]